MLVLDNCEHVVDAAARMVTSLLQANPALQIIATSRDPLRVEGEWVFQVPPLDIPAAEYLGANDPLRYGAVQLFIERTRAAEAPTPLDERVIAAIVSICRRLDGIPLAIELAAARAAALGVEELASRLDDRFNLLTGGRRTALPRQRTLRATFDWSYDLLPELEQRILRRLSVFAGSFTLSTAGEVAASTGLSAAQVVGGAASLVEKSLVAAELRGPEPRRYRLLETTRAYAREKLHQNGEADDTARHHAEYFRSLFEQSAPEPGTRQTTEWLTAYRHQIDEVRGALEWAFSSTGDVTIGVALTIGSEPLWIGLSLMDECRRRVQRALSRLPPGSENARAAMRLNATLAAALYYTKGPSPEVCAAWTEVLAIAERLDDTEYRLRALWGLWVYRLRNAECQTALTLAQRFVNLSPSRAEPNDLLVGARLLGSSLHYLGDQTAARRHFEHMLSHYPAPVRRSHIMRYQLDQVISAQVVLARVLWI